jgi:sporulation protein YlmC with PRC-barrel domain
MTPSGHTQAIRAKKVLGTEVKNMNGEKLGSVEDIILDKMSNQIMFAVVGFGGVMGMGEKYHPVPWAKLDYDPDNNCYRTDISKTQIETAPADSIDALTREDGMAFRDQAYSHYGAERDWR